MTTCYCRQAGKVGRPAQWRAQLSFMSHAGASDATQWAPLCPVRWWVPAKLHSSVYAWATATTGQRAAGVVDRAADPAHSTSPPSHHPVQALRRRCRASCRALPSPTPTAGEHPADVHCNKHCASVRVHSLTPAVPPSHAISCANCTSLSRSPCVHGALLGSD